MTTIHSFDEFDVGIGIDIGVRESGMYAVAAHVSDTSGGVNGVICESIVFSFGRNSRIRITVVFVPVMVSFLIPCVCVCFRF